MNIFCVQVGYECYGFLPVLDGVVIPDWPENLRARGVYNQVPEIIGCTEDEGSLFVLSEHLWFCMRCNTSQL